MRCADSEWEMGDLTPDFDVLFVRHVSGDWSDMCLEDNAANKQAITEGSRVFSAYQIGADRFFVITEADRSATTILLANEY